MAGTLDRFISTPDRAAVARAISEAENGTSGEIVPVVAAESGRYDRAEDLFGVLTALLLVAVVWTLFQKIHPVSGSWASPLALGLSHVLSIFVIGYVAGSSLASRCPFLKRPFVSDREMREEVERGALAAFNRFHVRRTAAGTGVLIYISLFERMVHVLGDIAIGERLTQADWDGVRDAIIAGIGDGRPAEGIRQGVLACGQLLSRHFPAAGDGRDEIHNRLYFLD